MSNAKIRVGRGKIDASRTKGRGALGLTNKDKLKLSKSGLKDLLAGVMAENRKKRKKEERKKGTIKFTGNEKIKNPFARRTKKK